MLMEKSWGFFLLFNKRINMLTGLFFLAFSFLLLHFSYYQLIQGEELSRKVISMHSQGIDMRQFPRGDIYDRHLNLITSNSGASALYCLPQTLLAGSGSQEQACRNLARFLVQNLEGLNENAVFNQLDLACEQDRALIKLDDHLSPAETARIQAAHQSSLIIAPSVRRYRQDGFMAHLLGYVSTTGSGEGQAGVEKAYEQVLRGGGNGQVLQLILDARGQVIPGIKPKIRTGETIKDGVVLTIDKRVQELVEKTMNQRVAKGAVVVMDVNNKEILAMASRPAFNPYQVQDYLFEDIDSTLTNRALAAYYPGSLFKIVVSIAALQEQIVSTEQHFNCTGKYVYNDQLATTCWKEGGHGEVTFAEAFANSCNPTFIRVGLKLGRARLLQQAAALHLTDRRLIGLGQINAQTYVKIDGSDAAMGNACLGQQGVMLTPLQISSLLATVADDGCWAPPVIVKYTLDSQGKEHPIARAAKVKVIDSAVNREVQQMMEKVVAEGTGKAAGLSEIRIAGKTATSQTGNIGKNGEEILNTWFAGYFPAEDPRWAIVVLVEEGKSGAQNCAPVFKDISRGILKISP